MILVLVEQKRPSLHPIHLANYEELQRMTMQAGKKSIASALYSQFALSLSPFSTVKRGAFGRLPNRFYGDDYFKTLLSNTYGTDNEISPSERMLHNLHHLLLSFRKARSCRFLDENVESTTEKQSR